MAKPLKSNLSLAQANVPNQAEFQNFNLQNQARFAAQDNLNQSQRDPRSEFRSRREFNERYQFYNI